MRSALICVFIALIIQTTEGSSESNEDFRPTPIPLSEWHGEKQAAETLHEIVNIDTPPTIAAVPAHYWEDALRHSVYLTLVRDKIDQLIAKGTVISSDSKPNNNLSTEVDDRDLWEKIKTAQFDRRKEEPIPPSDVTILAKGRLLEEKSGFRFAEDDVSEEKCNDEKCTKNVKAYWSVKRVKQGDTAGKYHYEITFAVTSLASKKVKKTYENPLRSFTVKETKHELPVVPKAKQIHFHNSPTKPQTELWFHKNIVPTQPYTKRLTSSSGLERIFSSLFSDDYDSYEEPTYRYKQPPNHIPHPHPQHTRVGHVEPPHQQKKIVPYPVKHHPVRYSRPPLQAPPNSYVPSQPYIDVDPIGYNPNLPPYSDNKYGPSNAVKTTRPAVLPTPITSHPLLKESTIDAPVKTKLNSSDYTTTETTVTSYKTYNQKQTPMKVSYMPDHVRPPVYNAPPGVFVTMDKKPFKPLPPFKYATSGKPHKNIPYDFRPSPQILDSQSSSIDSTESFRPINIGYTDIFGSNEKTENDKKEIKNHRKPSTKKTTKKNGNIKSQNLTTAMPDIITIENDISKDDDSMEWANLMSALAKTTPMASQTDKITTENSEITTTIPITTPDIAEKGEELDVSNSTEDVSSKTELKSTSTTTTTTPTTTTVSPTMHKTKKRTRPPPSFKKLDKVKKHKRITTSTTTTSTSTTTTPKPTRIYPEKKKPSHDLTPQASSAATNGANSLWETKPEKPWTPMSTPLTTPKSSPTTILTTSPTTPTTTTTTTSTTPITSTSTTPITSTSTQRATFITHPSFVTAPMKNKSRFRQSTLMYKGTSVKHDKWSGQQLPVIVPNNRPQIVQSNKFPLRRKVSKFNGYIPTTTPRLPDLQRNREDHEDRPYTQNKNENESTTQHSESISIKSIKQTQQVNTIAQHTSDNTEQNNNTKINDVQDFSKHSASTTPITPVKEVTVEETTVETSNADAKNKTKCKKKNLRNSTSTENTTISNSETTTETTTMTSTAADFLTDLFGGFTMDDFTESTEFAATPEPSQSAKYEHFVGIDKDVDEFLDSIGESVTNENIGISKKYEYDDESDEESPFVNDEENESFESKQIESDYYDEGKGREPYNLLEVMTMD